MITNRPNRSLLGGLLTGASAIAALSTAQAQEEEFAQECVDLFVYVEDQADVVLDEQPILVALIEDNDGAACAQQLTLLQRQANVSGTPAAPQRERAVERERGTTATRTEREVARPLTATRQVEREAERQVESRVVREQVEVEQTVTVAGDVDVAVGVPTVRVQQAAPTVAVQGQPAEVTVEQAAPTIVVREAPARIRMEMPTITIEQDAPEIIVTLPEPGVRVANAEPRVEVRMAEPRVSVAVPDPVVNMDLRAVAGETAEEVRTRITEQREAAPAASGTERLIARRDQGADANVLISDAEPNVEVTGLDQDARVTVNAAEPDVRFENAEPQVEVVGEPRVEYRRVGEPRVTFNRSGADVQPAAGETREERRGFLDRLTDDDDDTREAAATTRTAPVVSAGDGMLVSELVGRSVTGQNGEELGEIGRFVRSGGGVYAVIERGGFLGLGEKEIAMPAENLLMSGEGLTAANLTEERVEQLRDQDINARLNLSDEDRVTIGG